MTDESNVGLAAGLGGLVGSWFGNWFNGGWGNGFNRGCGFNGVYCDGANTRAFDEGLNQGNVLAGINYIAQATTNGNQEMRSGFAQLLDRDYQKVLSDLTAERAKNASLITNGMIASLSQELSCVKSTLNGIVSPLQVNVKSCGCGCGYSFPYGYPFPYPYSMIPATTTVTPATSSTTPAA